MFDKKEDKKEEKKVPETKGKKEKSMPKVNEEHFRVGDKLEVSELPFKVKEVRGCELVIARTDIK